MIRPALRAMGGGTTTVREILPAIAASACSGCAHFLPPRQVE